jgi:uncharacterized protein YyaL (SSP411 family)
MNAKGQPDSTLPWRSWDDETFAEAKRLGRPLCVVVTAAWCRHSRALVELLENDPALRGRLADDYVAVAVDKDKRPDVDARLGQGGWPTLAIVDATGELLAGGVGLDRNRIEQLLERVARIVRERGDELASRVTTRLAAEDEADRAKARRRGELTEELVLRVQGAIVDEFDPEYGGFGGGQKFPHNEAIDFALLRYVVTRAPQLREVALTTLSRIAESPMHDVVDGGFFRYSKTRDWRTPNTEKLLETNVGLLRNYLEAYQTFELPEFKRVAEEILGYLEQHLRHPTLPAFGGSQDSDDAYYGRSAGERAHHEPPRVDWTIYVNWNAAAVSALLKAASVLGKPRYRDLATETLEFLLEECYDRGRGMYHYHDGIGRHLQGLLTDQVWTARALLHAAQYTAEPRYLEIAEDLLGVLLQKQSAEHGGFYDVRQDAEAGARHRRRNQSILENGLIAELFVRAHDLLQKPDYLDVARRTLELFAEDYHLYGYYTAGYARAVDLYLNPPVHAVIVGSRRDAATLALAEAAAKLYLPSKLVQVVDPDEDAELLARFQLPRDGNAAIAYVAVRGVHMARETDADALVAAMRRAGAAESR